MKSNNNLSKTEKLKKRFLNNFAKSLGIISTACKLTKITRQTYYNWINTDNEFKECVNDIQEAQKDYVESKLIENIDKNDTTAIIFYLKTKAKDRGYTDKTEIELNSKDEFLKLMIEATSREQTE